MPAATVQAIRLTRMPSTWCVTIPHRRDRVERRQQRHEDRPTTFQAEVERGGQDDDQRDGGRDRGSGLATSMLPVAA